MKPLPLPIAHPLAGLRYWAALCPRDSRPLLLCLDDDPPPLMSPVHCFRCETGHTFLAGAIFKLTSDGSER